MLTTTSAIADVNFTEKTLFTSGKDMSDREIAYSIYFGSEDVNGISLTPYSTINNSVNNDNRTIDGVTYERIWYDLSCISGVTDYDKNYFQISSTQHAVKQLKVCVRGDGNAIQIIAIGWKGSIGDVADYCEVFKFNKINDYHKWVTLDISSWENVKNIRLYHGFGNSNLTVNGETVKEGVKGYSRPYIYGIQVGIGSTTTSISSYGVAAFSSGNALDFSTVTECSAFYADSYDNGVLHLTKATGVVPAHFGLLLSSTDGGAVSFSIPIATAKQAEDCTLTAANNMFVATDESTYTPTTSTEALALGVKNVKNGTAGFYYVGAGVTVPQYRFYLPAPSVGGAKNLTLDFDNATGITSIPFNDPATQNSVGESAIPSQTTQPTDLLGRPCPTPRAGALYIKGGKAYLTPAR